MSYQVLARKYRPRTFDELVGQEHVSRALMHALDQDRLHHAYLFTGTRGVGKTTIARILSRCLNCEEGVSSRPCGVCPTCQEIGEGRFVDLIEVDAASRTKVEDTRELLENVQYAPSRGRYKVYLIDEVHMLSAHSFNALLKTLEEPPPHVKFLLATTDPQKLPVTVLSRCLQFSLKALPAEQIARHLKDLLEREMIRFEEPALLALGKAARGSMRDALSLTDQAIAFGGEQLTTGAVSGMLGTVDRAHVRTLLRALAEDTPAAVLNALAAVSEHAPDELALLDELVSALHELAVTQALGESDDADMQALAGEFTAEQVQLYYDVALRGRRDVQDAPDSRAALEMTLLRMVLFSPKGVLAAGEGSAPAKKPQPAPSDAPAASGPGAMKAMLDGGTAGANEQSGSQARLDATVSAPPAQQAVAAEPAPEPALAPQPEDRYPPRNEPAPPPETAPRPEPGAAALSRALETAPAALEPEPDPQSEPEPEPGPAAAEQPVRRQPDPEPLGEPRDDGEMASWWAALLMRLPLDGAVRHLARNAVLAERDEHQWTLELSNGHQVLVNNERLEELGGALSDYYHRRIRVQVRYHETVADTPELLDQQRRQERLEEARASLLADDTVQTLMSRFGGRLDEDSIRPRD
ncbi:DNA polymerase III subunits gamma and tau [Alcanivorax xiamenensis]|uniref:DNA polymerase III subunit gamma/tau n=1 Tax=Alcanivorax xiamenensis TaxID=1177156 RepID=A0ABQ6Y9Y6_9GAMM|nr:DNA polymerase III subunit gamma/tau [Alcanivorax xiamenensis]KAF0806649.1 DNA polymerase III subunits gamma and tau [Alcanivorax xiamenensis]